MKSFLHKFFGIFLFLLLIDEWRNYLEPQKKRIQIEKQRNKFDIEEERQREAFEARIKAKRLGFEKKCKEEMHETLSKMVIEVRTLETAQETYEDTGPMLK